MRSGELQRTSVTKYDVKYLGITVNDGGKHMINNAGKRT